MQPGTVILQTTDEWADPASAPPQWLRFRDPIRVIRAGTVDQVAPALDQLAEAVRSGLFAAGFVAYEAAPSFDPAFCVRPPDEKVSLPLLWFGLYAQPDRLPDPCADHSPGAYRLSPWQPAMEVEDYHGRIARIREYIAAGDTYQVNFTFPLRADFEGDPWGLFIDLERSQRARHGAFVLTDRHAIASASPELFFAQSGDELVARPMKGTARRGRWCEEDDRNARVLACSAKDRAENVMIVDLERNDLGRVATPGSVHVPRLFDVERYETVLQMTSTVAARTDADPVTVLRALFPCGSITGAPKIRTMEIVSELEVGPRGIYTGAIGWIGPNRQARFNVAIRTVQIDRARGEAVFGVGGGVTWGSTPQGEYDECLVKAGLLLENRPRFELLETLLWEPGGGYFLMDRHLARLAESARYFRYTFDRAEVQRRLEAYAEDFDDSPQRVRLLMDETGRVRLESTPLDKVPSISSTMSMSSTPSIWNVALAEQPINPDDPFLYHKTTHRTVYEQARQGREEVDDVLLWNARGELTESTIANVVVQLDGKKLTPPRTCGLLAGVMRAQLLEEGEIEEGVIHTHDLPRAEGIWLINSVRRWLPAHIEK